TMTNINLKTWLRQMNHLVNHWLHKGGKPMVTIFDVVNYFLRKVDKTSGSSMTPLKLQKLVYYAQAWHLAFYGTKLFNEEFQAWVHGPVNYELWQKYSGFMEIEPEE